MSTGMLEREPNDKPHTLPDDVYAAAYNEYLESLVLRDIAGLASASGVIAGSRFPMADKIDDQTSMLNTSLLETNNKIFCDNAKHVMADVISSYVYSGLPLDASVIKLTARLMDHSDEWLKDKITPTPNLFGYMDIKIENAEHLRELTFYGRQALLQLRLGSLSLRIARRFLAT